jgi:hypothetical protein
MKKKKEVIRVIMHEETTLNMRVCADIKSYSFLLFGIGDVVNDDGDDNDYVVRVRKKFLFQFHLQTFLLSFTFLQIINSNPLPLF